jgi:PilZ domain
MGALAWKLPEPAEAERRHNQRVEVRLLGRFMRSDRKEFDCESIDASVNGIAFSSDAGVQFGERIVAYLNQIGRVEGRVARIFPGGFAIQMNVPPAKRDKLATQLAWLANRRLGCPRTGAMSASRRATGIRSCSSRTDANIPQP